MRLRIEGLVEVQHLPRLRERLKVTVRSSQVQGPQQTFTGHLQEITGIAVGQSTAGPVIVSGSEDGTVRVWNRAARREQRVLRHPAPVRAVACTKPGAPARCLSGDLDGVARLWDLDGASDVPSRELKGPHRGAVNCVAFSPDGRTCVTGGEDHQICLWDTATGALRYRFPAGHLGAVTALHFPLPSRVVSAGRDNTLRVWALEGDGVRQEKTLDRRSGDVSQPGVSADGKWLLYDQGDTLHVLSLSGGESAGSLRNSTGGTFTTLALFGPDAGLIVTGGASEGRLQLWRGPAAGGPGYEVRQLAPPDRAPATCAAFAPDGSFLVTGTRSRQMLLWPLPAADEVERPLAAQLTLVERAVESSARQVRVWAELPNPDGRLVPGTTVTLVIHPDD
jgi:WD40 repeat protein